MSHMVDENCEKAAKFLKSRVRSLTSDPLHSTAYLSNLASYLNRPFQKPRPARQNRFNNGQGELKPRDDHIFFYSYEISRIRPSKPVVYDKVSDFLLNSTTVDKSELIFLTGYPSPEWLNAIVARYGVDHRFLHRHVDFLPSGQRDWYTGADVPSRSGHFIRLLVPSIVFVGPEGRYVPVGELQKARNASGEQLRQKAKSFFGRSSFSAGQSIIRNMNIHRGDVLVMEQCLSGLTQEVIRLRNMSPFLMSKFFRTYQVASNSAPCSSRKSYKNDSHRLVDPVSKFTAANSHLRSYLVAMERLWIGSASAIQYLNMLRKMVSHLITRAQPIDVVSLNMEDILHFEYAKTALVRWAGHFRGLEELLDPLSSCNPFLLQSHQEERREMLLSLRRDLNFLEYEARTLIELCDNGRSTIMSNFSISESKRATEEARLVTSLREPHWFEWKSSGLSLVVVIVPGFSADTLAEQTCLHFVEWIDTCCAAPNSSMTVWIYDHGVNLDSRRCWDSLWSAGKELLQELLNLAENLHQPEDTSLVLIGHRLGSFILKKALVDAHRRNHHARERSLFEMLQTLVMIGDPYLQEENRSEWIRLIQECVLGSKKLSPEICSEQALGCLKNISDHFEDITIHSHFFQITGVTPTKPKLLRPRVRPKYKGCVCYANVTVRMWSTADDDDSVPESEGDAKNCVFHPQSKHHKTLVMIASNEFEPQRSLSGQDEAKHLLPAVEPSRNTTNITMDGNKDRLKKRLTRERSEKEFVVCHDTPQVEEENCRDLNVDGSSRNLGKPPNPNAFECDGDLEASLNMGEITSQSSQSPSPYDTDQGNTIDGTTKQKESLLDSDYDNVRQYGYGDWYKTSSQERVEMLVGIKDGEPLEASPTNKKPFATNRSHGHTVSNSKTCLPPTISTTAMPQLRKQLKLGLPCRPSRFVGRDEIMKILKSIFLEETNQGSQSNVVIQTRNMVALQGIGGIGKTATAIEFVHRYGIHFDHIFWIQGRNKLSLGRSFHEISVALGLVQRRNNHSHAESKVALDSWFLSTDSRWLMIFDDAGDIELLKSYIPSCIKGSIIVTSRAETSIELHHSHWHVIPVPLPPLSDNESLELLLNVTSFPDDMSGYQHAMEVGKLLGGHPLALSLAAAYISQGNGTLSDRIGSWYQVGRMLHLASSSADLSRKIRIGYQVPSLIIGLSLDNMSPEATKLSAVLSCLDPHDIQDSVLLGAQYCDWIPLEGFPLTDHGFSTAKKECLEFKMCGVGNKLQSTYMHRAVQRAILSATESQQLKDAFDTASVLLLAQWPSKRKFTNIVLGNWPEFDQLHSHVHRLSELFVAIWAKASSRNFRFNWSFTKLLVQSTWYNSRVRGNVEEDVSLIELAHVILASGHPKDAVINSRICRFESQKPRRLVSIDDITWCWRVVDTGGQPVDYCAMSYCWGDQSDPLGTARLTKSTLADFQSWRQISELPQLYRDACTIVVQLGVRYLWVDALCIVQDDDVDLRTEMSNLAHIYRKATCTIISDSMVPVLSTSASDHCLRYKSFSIISHGVSWALRSLSPNPPLRNLGLGMGKDVSTDVETDHMVDPCDDQELIFHVSALPEEWSGLFGFRLLNDSDVEHTDKGFTEDHPLAAMSSNAESQKLSKELATTDSNLSDHSHQLQRRIQLATLFLSQGLGLYNGGQPLQAIAKFVKARDCFSSLTSLTIEATQSHLLGSIYLALAYLDQQLPEPAVDILGDAETRLDDFVAAVSEIAPLIMGRFYLARGDAEFALKDYEKAQHSYDRATSYLLRADGEGADLFAVAQIKTSDIAISNGMFRVAHQLIQNAIAYFEAQNTARGQGQYARALHRQALAFGSEGNQRVQKVRFAAAKQALLDFREEQGHNDPFPDADLTKEDFENVLEFGFK